METQWNDGDFHRPKSENRGDFHRPQSDNTDRPAPRGKIRLSPEAKSRLLDGDNLSRFEIGSKKRSERPDDHRRRDNRDARRSTHRPPQKKHHG